MRFADPDGRLRQSNDLPVKTPDLHTETRGDTLLVTGLTRLTSENAVLFRDLIRATLNAGHRSVDIDLTRVNVVDSDGMGALISVHKRMRERDGLVRLLHPTSFVGQTLRLLKLDNILEIVD